MNLPRGQIAPSQAVTHVAKSAIRGSRSSSTSGKVLSPCATAVSSPPKIRERFRSKASHISVSSFHSSSGIGASVRKIARSAKSGRDTMSSMPLSMTGRVEAKSTSSSSVYN